MQNKKQLEKQAEKLQKDLDDLKKLINNTKEYTLEDIVDYQSACKILNKTPRNKKEYKMFFGDYIKWYQEEIETIIKAANYIDNDYQEWKPNFLNKSEYKYKPYFERLSSGWSHFNCNAFNGCSTGSILEYYKKESTAKLFSKKFKDLYSLYLGE